MSVRPVSSADFQAIADIYNYYVAHSVATFDEVTVSVADIEHRVAKVKAHRLPWFVAEDGPNNVLGYGYANPWKTRSAFRFTVELTVYLSCEARSQGWGTKLYSAVLGDLKESPVKTVVAGITLPNPASVAIHEKFGLRKVAHFENVGFKFERWLDVGYWQADMDEIITQWH